MTNHATMHMTNTTATHSGIIRRIHVETSDVRTTVRMTLAGESVVYQAGTQDAELREALELSAPGDLVTFSLSQSGWILKETTLKSFKNDTLAGELTLARLQPN